MIYIMSEGDLLTEEQQKIQTQIDEIKQKIIDLKPPIEKEKKDVADDEMLIRKYTDELKVLNDKLKNVMNTHKSQYDVIKGKINDLKIKVGRCNLTNKPNIIKNDVDANQNELNLQENLKKIKSDIAKIVEETAPYEVKTMLFNADIIGLNRDIGIISDEITELNKNKESNRLKIEELNQIISGLDRIILELEIKIYGNVVVNNKNLLNLSEQTDASLNYLISVLNKQRLSSDVIYDKITHRDIEHEHLYNRNKIFDILFYCFYGSFLLIMI